MNTSSVSPDEGPPILATTGLIPITPFAPTAGCPICTSPEDWEAIVRHNPYGILQRMMNAVDGALKTNRADIAHIDFRVWRDKKRSRLRASLYTTEEGQPWIFLARAPLKLKPGRR